jgi:hypothetical protein
MRHTATLVAGIVLLAGCNGEPTATLTEAGTRSQVTANSLAQHQSPSASVEKDLATLRAATAAFHRVDAADAAGWSAKITGCMSSPEGGMGFHYGNTNLIDGTVQVDSPELLLYEPAQNGELRLVAVEYIIPYTAHSRDAAPPVLFGKQFTQNDTFQLWGLHAWVWKENPSGMFANWNPTVGCEHTTDVMAMAHR